MKSRLGLAQIAEEAIELFLEYRDKHGFEEPVAQSRAVTEVVEGTDENDVEALLLTARNLGLEASLGALEKVILLRLISELGPGKDRLAEILRISRPTLYRLLKKHNLLKESYETIPNGND